MGTLKNHHSKHDVISIRYEEIGFRPPGTMSPSADFRSSPAAILNDLHHVHSVLGKLGVARRTQAMRRVREAPWIA
jgi:hypothetical protein